MSQHYEICEYHLLRQQIKKISDHLKGQPVPQKHLVPVNIRYRMSNARNWKNFRKLRTVEKFFSLSQTLQLNIRTGVRNYKGSDGKHLKFGGLPGHCPKQVTSLLEHIRQYANEWGWLRANKTLFTKRDSTDPGLDLALGP